MHHDASHNNQEGDLPPCFRQSG